MITFIFWWSLCFWVGVAGTALLDGKLTLGRCLYCLCMPPAGMLWAMVTGIERLMERDRLRRITSFTIWRRP
jgi:hypothetical protein